MNVNYARMQEAYSPESKLKDNGSSTKNLDDDIII